MAGDLLKYLKVSTLIFLKGLALGKDEPLHHKGHGS